MLQADQTLLEPPPPAPARAAGADSGVPAFLLLLGALLVPVLVYFSTAASIVSVWDRSETFAHGWVIMPISLWLIWQRRDTLRQLPVAPYWPALVALALCGAGWLIADLGEVAVARQYMFAAMLPLTVLAVLGRQIARALLFPLAFILFGVPFGEVFVPPLIQITANFTVDALVATGIPVLREGNSFTIPTGNWSVVEACSGVRYLISSVTLGCLYAYLSFRSRLRQAVFIGLSVVVPILANGMRAYMIVIIGHLSGMTLAVGVDHIIYGWVFFGLVMFLLFWIGSYWREDRTPGKPTPPAVPERADRSVLTKPVLTMLASVAVVIGLWPAWAKHAESSQFNPAKPDLSALSVLSWEQVPAFTDWTPQFVAPSAEVARSYRAGTEQAGVLVYYYRNQQQTGAKLVSSVNVLARDKGAYTQVSQAIRNEHVGARTLQVRETVLSNGVRRLLVWSWYWVGGTETTSDAKGKLLQVREKLLHGRDDGAAVLLYAPFDDKPEPARATLHAFAAASLPAIEATLDAQLAKGRP